MDKEKVLKTIGQVETLLAELKDEVGVLDKAVSPKGQKKAPRKSYQGKKPGSTKPIEDLIDSGFFDSLKTDVQATAALKKKAQFFERSDIAVTLMRFVKKNVLEREGNGTKNDPWKYKKK